MAPSISENNTAAITHADVEGSSSSPGEENHETNPTGQGGESLMWSEGAEPLSIYIATSDYDSADESVDHQTPNSPGSQAPSEAGYASASEDQCIAEPLPPPPSVFLVPVFDPSQAQLQFGFQPQPFEMYPPYQQGMIPQGVPASPGGGYYNETGLWTPPPQQHGVVPTEQMTYTYSSPSPHQQHGVVSAEQMNYTSPPPPQTVMMGPSPQQAPTPGPGMQHYPPQCLPQQPQQPPYFSPGGTVPPCPPPPPAQVPYPTPTCPPAPSTQQQKVTRMMPMPSIDKEGTMSVSTTCGPIVLFATAPGTSENNIKAPALANYPECVSQQMEIVWHGEFNRNFREFKRFSPVDWELTPTDQAPDNIGKWKIFKDSAKVRFMCHNCGNAWTSMKGRVMFWICLNEEEQLGGVLFKLYGQACDKCGSDDDPTFCNPMWYPEEVVKVISNLYGRTGQLYFGFQSPPLNMERRNGKPREHHNQKRCQACKEGVCRFEWVWTQ